ncbi:MAG TPA: mycothiol synthase [Kineosporiaceae bacterium]|nr:mycothiol synthase [Kineosporiaceae bacterium]
MSQPQPIPPVPADPKRADRERADQELPRVEISPSLHPTDVAAVAMLTEAATEADGVRPLSEHVSLHLRYGGEGPDRHLLLLLPAPDPSGTGSGGLGLGLTTTTGEIVVGYAHLDPTDAVAGSAAEVVTHPAYRGRGFGRLLVEAAAAQAPDGRLRLWAHGDHPAARQLAESLGFRVVRRLEQLRRSLYSPLPGLHLPTGVRLRSFRPGQDDAAWLELNARAFAGHPEQGGWTAGDLRARMQESWFDPEGFLIAEDDGPQGPRMVAFHWTKIHGGHPRDRGAGRDGDLPAPGPRHAREDDVEEAEEAAHGHDPIGEVYVVGVDPEHQGRGLGRSITVAGLRWLRARGLPQAMLYVETDNEPALAVYRSLGFTHWDTDVMFYRGSPSDG